MIEKQPVLLLIDGNSLIHRAFHALPPLTTSKTGEETGAVYGFTRMLLKVLGEFKPSHCAIAFDRPAPTFRHLKFEDYKAQRPPMPSELAAQFDRVRELVTALNIPIFEMDGYEADDILGTLSSQASSQGIDSIIVTGDTDALQLVSSQVRVLTPGRTLSDVTLYDESAVQQKYGIMPQQIPDLKGLKGDASDNIPGVPGVGEKTATKLLQQLGSIEDIYQRVEEVTPVKLRQTLIANKDLSQRSKELATIVTNVPITLNLDICKTGDYDREKVTDIFRELEFLSLLDTLPPIKTHGQEEGQRIEKDVYQIIDTIEALNKLCAELSLVDSLAIGIELAPKSGNTPGLAGLALSPSPGKAYYIPLNSDSFPPEQVIDRLRVIIENPGIAKITHNAKESILPLADCSLKLANLTFDTMIAAYLLGDKSLDIRTLTLSRLGIDIGSRSTTARLEQPLQTEPGIPPIVRNACLIADITGRLSRVLEPELHREGLWRLFTEVELPLIPVLARMERNGIVLDVNIMTEISHSLEQQLLHVEDEIYSGIGHRININSPRQLSIVLFEELRLPYSRRTKKGYSTDASVLEELRGVHPVVEHILEYRRLAKLKSTYIDPLPSLVNPRTGRLHTSFNQTATTTGRLSSSNPNLQNIPLRGDWGKMIRRAFVSTPSWMLLAGDYSQIELRILAHLSQDDCLITAFRQDKDIHAATAAEVFNVPLDRVTPEMRRVAKVVNFGVAYGMSDYGLEQATELSREEASQFINSYFEKYQGVQNYITHTKQQVKEKGYVETLLGRRRYIPEVHSPNYQIREAAERMAINMPVQGTAADIIKIAMIQIQRELDQQGLDSKMLLQVHDELIFEVPLEELEEMKSLVEKIMSGVIELSIPLKVTIKVGTNWGEME